MTTQNENFGIMDEAYFVSRTEILSWVNDLLKINVTKIEELGSGAVYCQIMDAIYPGKVSMAKVNWRAKVDYQFLNNYKILQSLFDKMGIKKYIQVERLAKAKYQDNLQFIQWLKRYYQVNVADKSVVYPAEERRGSAKPDFGYAEKLVVPKNFNGGGQVIPKNRVGSKERRTESGASGHKESAKRLASPPVAQKVKTSSHEKRGSVIEHKEGSSKQLNKPPIPHHPNTHLPPAPVKQKSNEKPQIPEESIRPNRASLEELQKYKKMVRDLESKLEMIAQIAQTHDEAEVKMKLIEQVLTIGSSSYSKVSEFQASHAKDNFAKHLETIRTQEAIDQSIHNNQSLVQQQAYTFKTNKDNDASHQTSKIEKQFQKVHCEGEDEEQVF